MWSWFWVTPDVSGGRMFMLNRDRCPSATTISTSSMAPSYLFSFLLYMTFVSTVYVEYNVFTMLQPVSFTIMMRFLIFSVAFLGHMLLVKPDPEKIT